MSFSTQLVSWSTKIEVARNCQNKIIFQYPQTCNYSPLFHSSMHNLTIPCILYMLPYLFPVYSYTLPINDIAFPLPPRRNH
jgi:hypothetical protein